MFENKIQKYRYKYFNYKTHNDKLMKHESLIILYQKSTNNDTNYDSYNDKYYYIKNNNNFISYNKTCKDQKYVNHHYCG